MMDKKEVGQRIQIIRKEKGMTMEEFGNHIGGVLKSNVSKWERGDSLPNNARLKRIAEISEVSVEFLLNGEVSFNLSTFLKKERGNKTQEAFSKELDISRSYLNDLEAGRRSPSIDTLEKIADRLNKKLTISFDSK